MTYPCSGAEKRVAIDKSIMATTERKRLALSIVGWFSHVCAYNKDGGERPTDFVFKAEPEIHLFNVTKRKPSQWSFVIRFHDNSLVEIHRVVAIVLTNLLSFPEANRILKSLRVEYKLSHLKQADLFGDRY